MVIGAYYLTEQRGGRQGRGPRRSATCTRSTRAYDERRRSTCTRRSRCVDGRRRRRAVDFETTAGRLLFEEALPVDYTDAVRSHRTTRSRRRNIGVHRRAPVRQLPTRPWWPTALDAIKNLCYRYAAQSGLTISIDDVKTPTDKGRSSTATRSEAEKVENQFRRGIITDGERRQQEVAHLDRRHRPTCRRRWRSELQGAAVQPHRHDGRLGCSREHDAGPPDRRHARPRGQPPR